MNDSEMKNRITKARIFLCIWIVCMLAGALVASSAPDNVFIAIALIAVGAVFAIISVAHSIIVAKMHNDYKEDRIKKLEEEVELLKKKIN